MSTRRKHLWVLAWLGAFLAHQLGYGVATGAASSAFGPDHGYLAGFASLVPPLLIAAIALTAVAMVRHRIDLGATGTASLATAQLAAFLSVEVFEFALAGELESLVTTPAVWFGAAAQPVVAWMILRAVHLAAGVVARVNRVPGREPAIDLGRTATAPVIAVERLLGRSWTPRSPRAPPVHA